LNKEVNNTISAIASKTSERIKGKLMPAIYIEIPPLLASRYGWRKLERMMISSVAGALAFLQARERDRAI